MPDSELIFKDECYRIMGACFEVYKDKGSGLPEAIYQECLEIECGMQGIPAIGKPQFEIEYRGRILSAKFIPDLLCYRDIIVELKAVEHLADAHRAQVISYLRAGKKPLGILVNFGHYPKLEWERIAATRKTPDSIEPPDFRA